MNANSLPDGVVGVGGSTSERLRTALLLGLFAALIGYAHYWRCGEFGIYADDVVVTAEALDLGFEVLAERLAAPSFRDRFLLSYVPLFLASVGASIAGLKGVYVMAALVFWGAACALFFLLKRAFGTRLAFAATACFVLFPADMNKAYLMHGFLHYATLGLCFSACLLYSHGWRKSALLLVATTLFYYESSFLPFLLAPLLLPRGDLNLRRDIPRHAVSVFVCLALALLLRLLGGDFRFAGEHSMVGGGGAPGIFATAGRALLNMFCFGPTTALASFPRGVGEVVWYRSPQISLSVGVGTILASAGLWALPEPARGNSRRTGLSPTHVRALWVGLLGLIVAYALSFSLYPASEVLGRDTRVHSAAAFGASIIVGVGICWAEGLFRRRGLRVGAVLIGLLLGLLVARGHLVQEELAQNWQKQRWLWQRIDGLCPDVGEGTRIFVIDDGGLPEETRPLTPLMSIRGWSCAPIYFQFIYTFPKDWSSEPRAFVVSHSWEETLEVRGGALAWPVPAGFWWEHWEALPEGNVIIISTNEAGELRRLTGRIRVPSGEVTLKPLGAAHGYPPRPLHDLLIR